MGLPPPGVPIPHIRLSRDGDWYVDGERILHERTCDVLTRNVHFLDDGRYATAIGREEVPIDVDDVGFFVVSYDDGRVRLSDDSEEWVERLKTVDDRLYTWVKGRAWARFSRAAHQAIAKLVEERDGQIGVRIGARWLEVKS